MLQCHVKGCNKDNYPLKLQQIELKEQETEFNPHFIERLIPKIDYPALLDTCTSLAIDLPGELPEELSEEVLQLLHNVLFAKIIEGEMVCQGCGHVYPIKEGIANMLLNDNEV